MITDQKATPANNAKLLHEEAQAENHQPPSNCDTSTHGLFAPPSLAGCRRQRRLPPAIGKNSQFYVAFALLLTGLSLTGAFALNRSFINIPALGVPASAAIAFGTVYMFCAVGVYV
ncbi:hypothetical protein HYQ45_011154 [Verticillium longisporum]|uniref:Dolichyl-diphosphooligosaccharide-protein glycosyltransferase subunit OST5 n=1 Tax=Verticillium longisporum TaxID=100787 RepID=A0A8I2ZGS8_VERLO|nr:hypothetical protein HYQ45_011154 [Verticillium longisporum]